MFKIGDRVALTSECKYIGGVYGFKVGDTGILRENGYGVWGVYMDKPKNEYRWLYFGYSELISCIEIATPPQKIQQNGYEYSLVGPVKPEWLVDGAWVVNKETGILYRIIVASGGFICVDKTGLGDRKELDYITSNFRPHAASDWEWGDWAMYAGKRVFVVCPEHHLGHAMISGDGFPDGLKYVSFHDLTPTF